MYRPRASRALALCLLAGASFLGPFTPAEPARPADHPAPTGPVYHPGPRHLWNRLHEALFARLALSPRQARDLPDNYVAAVASGEFPRRFAPGQPDRPHLPPDLFAADGPWVCLGRPDGPAAPQHVREDYGNPFTNSVFL